MKKNIILIWFLFILLSCWENDEKWLIDESTQIISDYANTLEWNIKDAHDIKKMVDLNQQNLQDRLDNIK